MASFAKKLKRKQFVMARKKFMKDFKSSMKNFKKQVVCSKCDRAPEQGENIDDWHIDKYSEKIDLICTSCYTEKESEETNDQIAEDTIV
jgi:transcription elongation factor Elf1